MVLAELLRLVETTSTPLTCGQLADRLGIDPGVVAGMLDWLSRSGRLRDDPTAPAQGTCDPSACGVAGGCGGCPFAALPATGRRFLAVRRVSP
jgi:hypothetical protein